MGLLRVEAAARAAADADVACAELLPPAHGVRSPAAGHGADEEEDPPEAEEPPAGAREDPAPFLLASNFSVHCSFQDAFPQSVLESVLLGRTVLINEDSASAFPGDPEDLGLLPVPSTPEGIADGVTRLASDPRYRDTLASKGRLAVADRFSWSKSVDRFVDLYGL